jgi:leucyl aminopeptidase (aminopeptidase T)
MYPLELIQSVRLITDVCLEVAPGQDVLCIADTEESMGVMTLTAAECKARGAEVAAVLIEPRKRNDHEPPRAVAKAMQETDIVVAMVFGSLIHTEARKKSCAAGVKYAALAGATKEYLASLNLTREDLIEVRNLTEAIAQRLTVASSARLTTRAGTDLTMSLEGRKGVALLPFGEKGSFCSVPAYAEAPCAPIENSVEGLAVVDGTMLGAQNFEGVVQEPVKIKFERGRIVNISGGKDAQKLESLLDSLEEGARTFAELGINSNHKVPKELTGARTDNAIAGNVHIGLGRNDHIGGKSKSETHLDLLITSATLLLDETPILEDGRLKI